MVDVLCFGLVSVLFVPAVMTTTMIIMTKHDDHDEVVVVIPLFYSHHDAKQTDDVKDTPSCYCLNLDADLLYLIQ